MTKSLTNALCGILVRQGKLDLTAPAAVPEWSRAGDARQAITVDLLLRQSSGLLWNEVYESSPLNSNVIAMLYGRGHRDMAAFAAAQPLVHPPGAVWAYSSGTTLILQRILRSRIGSDAEYHAFPRQALFDPIGMKSALIEPDAAGTFVGSSYSYATARDWARFGLLYLRDGSWKDTRILPEGWVDYTRTPAPAAPHGEYGAHFWLNAGAAERGAPAPDPRAPTDLFYASGHDGQVIAIVPSRDLVIVRLGLTPQDGRYDVNGFVAEVTASFPRVGP
jgi:CubicO group peptidase (beta-lactamase class C family)